jgi:hypothetical protein
MGCQWSIGEREKAQIRRPRPASPMSMSGTDLSTKPAASCSRARTSRARSGACVPMTACISPGLARASLRIISSARSRGCSLPGPRRLRCRPSWRRPTPMRCRGSLHRTRWPDRSCRWWLSSVGTDQLLGGPGSRPAAVDPLAARTLVKGEPPTPLAGRADDFSWPRREVGREQAKGETPSASVRSDAKTASPAPPRKTKETPGPRDVEAAGSTPLRHG